MDAEKLLGHLLRGTIAKKKKKPKGLTGAMRHTALSPQGLTLLGGIAYAAYEHFLGKDKGGQTPATPPPPPSAPRATGGAPAATPPPPPPSIQAAPGSAEAEREASILIQAMITAAKADGRIDPEERKRILGRLFEDGADPEDYAFIEAELRKPMDIDALVDRVDNPVLAAEVYTASLMTIDADTPAERGYLALLAARLGLDDALVADLHRRVEDATEDRT